MATEIFLTRTLSGQLQPADAESQEAIYELPLNKAIKAVVSLPRNYKRLKWWWKLCQIVADNSERYTSQNAVSDMLKLKCGHFDTIVVPGREKGTWTQQYVPRSISFGSMDEPAFKALCNKAVAICAEHILNCDEHHLHDAVNDFFTGVSIERKTA